MKDVKPDRKREEQVTGGTADRVGIILFFLSPSKRMIYKYDMEDGVRLLQK